MAAQQPDELGKLVTEQRLASGQPQLVYPQSREDAHQAVDLFEGENGVTGQPGILLFRHTVPATHVAAVRDGDPQRLKRAVKYVGKRGSWAAGRQGGAHDSLSAQPRCGRYRLYGPPLLACSTAPLPRCPPAPLPTHSTDPSTKTSRFQIGTRRFTSSIT